MKILFDHQIFDIQRYGGISRYFYELIAGLDAQAKMEWDLSTVYSNNEYLKCGISSISSKIIHGEQKDYLKDFLFGARFKGKGKLFEVKNKFFSNPHHINHHQANKKNSIQKLKEGNFDVFHPTYYDDYFLEYIGDKPYVLTVYDLIHQIFPEYFLKDDFVDKNINLLKGASQIIAISESTKEDLVNLFGISEEKITVTYLANSMNSATVSVTDHFMKNVPGNYILFTGHRFHYKNFLFFAQVISSLINEYPNLKIVCTGYPFTEDELQYFRKLKLIDRMMHFYVSDGELAYLYQHANAFIFPSLYEGFGLPLLEAFSCGCPVLCSRSSSLSEVGGDAVLYFDPKDSLSMTGAIREVIANSNVRKQMIERGYRQLEKFSWSKTTEQTVQIYQHLESLEKR